MNPENEDRPAAVVDKDEVRDLSTSATRAPRAWSMGYLALVGTFVLPGLGHLLAGRYRRAAVWFGLTVVSNMLGLLSLVLIVKSRLLWSGLAFIVLLTVPLLYIWVDAFLCGWRAKRPLLHPAWLRLTVGTGMLIGSAFFQPWLWAISPIAYYVRDHHVGAYVEGAASMAPTIKKYDRVLVDRQAKLERWCVVVHVGPSENTHLKRLVGLPGETIEIKGGEIHVNGVALPRPAGVAPYLDVCYFGQQDPSLRGRPGAGCQGSHIDLADSEYYVLGDNSAGSLDSRLWETPIGEHQLGALPGGAIVGRVTHIYWPPSRWRVFD